MSFKAKGKRKNPYSDLWNAKNPVLRKANLEIAKRFVRGRASPIPSMENSNTSEPIPCKKNKPRLETMMENNEINLVSSSLDSLTINQPSSSMVSRKISGEKDYDWGQEHGRTPSL